MIYDILITKHYIGIRPGVDHEGENKVAKHIQKEFGLRQITFVEEIDIDDEITYLFTGWVRKKPKCS